MKKHRLAIPVLAVTTLAALQLVAFGASPAEADISYTVHTGDFAYPYDWVSTTIPASKVQGWDPINMIIVPKGSTTFTPDDLASAMNSQGAPWKSVGIGTDLPGAIFGNNCISEQDAAVEPGVALRFAQDFSWRRLTLGCIDPALVVTGKTANHVRGYLQPSSGAWFLAVSEEQYCNIPNVGGWHCITPTGYNQGRDHLVTDLTLSGYSVSVTYIQAYAPGEPPESATNPLGRTPYDGRVAVVSVAKSPSSAPPPVIPTVVADVEGGGSFADKWQSDGGSSGFLGRPTGNWSLTDGGEQQAFSGGNVYWSPSTGTHEVNAGNLSKYLALGGTGSLLGFPTSDEQNAPGGGRENTFAGSSCNGSGSVILWTSPTGSHEMHGCIYHAYLATYGGPAGATGYPVKDEQAISTGRVSYMAGSACGSSTGSAIYWNGAAHVVRGCAYQTYKANGETANLGFPTADEFTDSSGWHQFFQNGRIDNGTVTLNSSGTCTDYGGTTTTGPNACVGFYTTSTWFSGGGVGLDGQEIWTYANGTVRDSTANYTLHGLDVTHAYTLQAYIPDNHSNATHAHYHYCGTNQGCADGYVNQANATDAWVTFGTVCTTDGTATITLADDGGDNYPLQIGADAIHAVRTGIIC